MDRFIEIDSRTDYPKFENIQKCYINENHIISFEKINIWTEFSELEREEYRFIDGVDYYNITTTDGKVYQGVSVRNINKTYHQIDKLITEMKNNISNK